MKKTLTIEQREAKNLAERNRRAAKKAATQPQPNLAEQIRGPKMIDATKKRLGKALAETDLANAKPTVETSKTLAKAADEPENFGADGELKKTIKLDWAFRRLVNQCAVFLADGDKEEKKEWLERLESATTWSQVEATVRISKKQSKWIPFMNHFFGHRINKSI